MRDYTSLTRTLLGVPDSLAPTETTLQPLRPEPWHEPEAEFGTLPIDEDLMREYNEFLDSHGTLSGQSPRTNPMVPQIVPGQVMTGPA